MVVSVPAKQQWCGSTGDPGGRRYTNVYCYFLFMRGVKIPSVFTTIYFGFHSVAQKWFGSKRILYTLCISKRNKQKKTEVG